MFSQKILAGAVALGLSTLSALAGDFMIMDSYIRTSGPTAKTGAAFMQIANHGTETDTLVGATSDVAKRVELHTHTETGDGIMKMHEIEGGVPIEPGGMHVLKRGGDHVMFMGLTRLLATGDVVTVTLIFEKAGEVTLEIPVDLEREPSEGEMQMDHSSGG